MILQVSSHRRSGTHALIDTIRENFETKGSFFHLEDIISWWKDEEKLIIVKSHEPENGLKLKILLAQRKISEEQAQDLSDSIFHVHAYRDPYDVLKSLYYFNIAAHEPVYAIPQETSFIDFLNQTGVQDAATGENRVQFWNKCIQNWISKDKAVPIAYDDITNKSTEIARRIANHTGLQLAKNSAISTAVGRETTRNLSKGDIWDKASLDFFQKNINIQTLEKLNFKIRHQ